MCKSFVEKVLSGVFGSLLQTLQDIVDYDTTLEKAKDHKSEAFIQEPPQQSEIVILFRYSFLGYSFKLLFVLRPPELCDTCSVFVKEFDDTGIVRFHDHTVGLENCNHIIQHL